MKISDDLILKLDYSLRLARQVLLNVDQLHEKTIKYTLDNLSDAIIRIEEMVKQIKDN